MIYTKNVVILDTETTGLGSNDEIIELAIICAETGRTLFNERFRPTRPISAAAFSIHNISNTDVVKSPRFYKRFDVLMSALNGKTIIGWRCGFDSRLLIQTINRYGITIPKSDYGFIDMKPRYLRFLENHIDFDEEDAGYDVETYLQGDDSIHLTTACEYEEIDISDLTPHNALSDCKMVYRLIKKINQFTNTKGEISCKI